MTHFINAKIIIRLAQIMSTFNFTFCQNKYAEHCSFISLYKKCSIFKSAHAVSFVSRPAIIARSFGGTVQCALLQTLEGHIQHVANAIPISTPTPIPIPATVPNSHDNLSLGKMQLFCINFAFFL